MNRIRIAMVACLGAVVVLAGADDGRVTFNRDVAPILYANCVSCHRPGEIAPMSLLDYPSARPWAKSIRKVVADRTMPPWHADSSKVRYLNDPSLERSEIETIVKWVDQGSAEGDKADRPEAPKFARGWSMGEPDMIFHAKRDFTVPAEGNEIEYQLIPFHVDLDEDLYISEWEIRPSSLSSVHHANLVRAPKSLDDVGAGGLIGNAVMMGGDYIGSYLPGSRPLRYAENMAYRIPKGSSIAIQVHYVGIGEEVTDHIMFGVKFAQGRVDRLVRVVGTDDRDINIAPHQADFQIVGEVSLLHDVYAMSSGAHMHLRGWSYTMEAVMPDGTTRLITDVPRYDFNWQSNYQLAEPVLIPKGGKLRTTSRWNNSKSNPNNPDPDSWVHYGEWTDDEMINSWTHVTVAGEKLGLKIEDGRMVGKYPDAQDKPHPFFLQTLPNAPQFQQKPKSEGKDKQVSSRR